MKYLDSPGRGVPVIPTCILIVAVPFHFSAIVFFPVLLYLWISGKDILFRLRINAISLMTVLSICIAFGIAIAQLAHFEIVLPLHEDKYYAYSLLSTENFWDKFNFVLFVAPASAIIALIAGLKIQKINADDDRKGVFLLLCVVSVWVS